MEASKERRDRKAAGADDDGGADSVQLPTATSPYVQYDGLEDYKMRGYGAQGHLPVSDVPHGGSGTDAPTIPGTAVPVAQPQRHGVQPQRAEEGGGAARRGGDTATDLINRHGVP